MLTNRIATVVVFIAVAVATVAGADRGQIQWRSGIAETDLAGPQAATQALSMLASKSDGAADRHVVVQFAQPPLDAERARLAAAGVTLLTYVGDNAFFAAVDRAKFDADGLTSVTSLAFAAPIQRDWKLHPALVADEVLPWMLATESLDALGPDGIVRGDPTVGVYVTFHPDVTLDGRVRELLTLYGATVRSHIRSINSMVIELPYSLVKSLAAEDEIQYITPPLPQFSELNNSNRDRVGATTAQAAPYGLDGNGVRALVYDGGTVLTTHPDLVGRVRNGDGGGLSDHSTHVAGTIGGDGSASSGLYRGMAPAAAIDSYEFDTGGPLEAGFLYTDPGDIEVDYTESVNVYGSDIANNSIGTNTAPNGFPCDWEGDYGPTSALIDAIVRGSLGAPYRVVWAAGNERGSGRCGSTYHTTAPPANAKNHLCIGALNSNDDSVTYFSSWGPADDGRLKPDFAAPGCQTNDDNTVTSCSSSGGYTGKCGTSMASPTTTGSAVLFLQDFRLQYPGEPDPRNSTLKAIFAQTAQDIESVGPDYRSGYGSLRIVPAIDLMRAGNFFEGEVGQGETVQVLVVVGPTDPELKVTLAWDDVPGTPNVDPALVNDLDLRVFSPTLVRHYPWTLNPAIPADAAVQTQEDHLNNIEQVVVSTPVTGAYLIEIHGYNVPSGPQSFSLAASPLLVQCSTQGAVELDRAKYACQATATISVNDCDLNTDGLVVETVDITIASTSEPGGETVTLTETGPETAFFLGSIPIDTADANDVLLVAPGDTITATYIDADDGFGGTNIVVTDTAPVDCTAPVISNVQVVDIDPRSARVTFDTDEPTSVLVNYGADCATLTSVASAPGFNTSHSVEVFGLTDNTPYAFEIVAEDQAGNVTIDDNGGACYTFTTPEIPDYFTELFTPFDLANTALLFAPNGSVDYYELCEFETLVLPTDPVGGTLLSLTDTGSATVQLTGGHEVLLYGTSYTTLYVNANGNLTFDGPDSDSTETIDDHFAQPRVSVFFDDIDPTEGGQISYKELADRVAVTWLNVTEDAAANSNTFQIELYYDGRIQLAWLGMDAADGLAGLAQGLGTPIDFLPTDLSEFGSCGPRPPSAASRTVVFGEERPDTFTLLASDDGLPDPPAAITYLITALPTYELRDNGNGHLITAGELPYALVGGGNELHYTPGAGFVGLDSFDFIASDGGAPPEGGESNVATVTLQVDPVLDLPIFDAFPTTSFNTVNWSIFENAAIDDFGIDEPSPPYSARLNGTPSGQDLLVTHMIDLSTYAGARVRYAWQRTGNGESPDSGENLWVEYVDANGVWQVLTQYAGDGADMTTYIDAEFSLPAPALHDSFRLRFRTKGTSGSSNFDDWFVDDVFIGAPGMPYASGGGALVHQDGAVDITLIATDPNDLPLTYIIASLPDHGVLSDPNVGLLDPNDLPYALVAGNTVHYEPDAGYSGYDGFAFQVDNGLYLSNLAAISILVEPVLNLPFFEPFPSEIFDPLRWRVIDGVTADGLGSNEPSEPYAARFNGNPSNGDVLESFPIDLSTVTSIRLRYYWERTGNGESPDANEDLWVEYLNDVGAWVEIARYAGDGPDMTDFAIEDIALPADAHHADFRLRFSNTATSGNVDDWFVDDIELYSSDAPTAYDQTIALPKYAWSDVTLLANDPGEDPLTFTVLSLPAHGSLTDRSNGHVLEAADLPYTLAAGEEMRYIPDFGYTGSDVFAFQAYDGLYNSNIADVTIDIGGTLPIVNFPLDSDPGWSTDGLWEFGAPQGVGFDPPVPASGQYIYGYNLAGDYENEINPPNYLTTTALDCSRISNAELHFQRWLGVEDALFDHASIEISTNGSSWSTVWEHTGGNINDLAWTPQSFDIAAVADGQATVYVRWGMGPTDDSATFSGWHLDDIAIYGEFVGGPGDLNDDGNLDAADLTAFRAAYPSCEGDASYDALADLDGDGCVTLYDFVFWAIVYRDFVGNPNAPLPGGAFGDYDGDGFVDGADFAGLTLCLTGPDNAATSGCEEALDLDVDGDIDMVDVAWFEILYPY